jgi:hypothetical protein
MDLDVLREQLAQLHEELRDANHVDPAVRRLLGEIMRDIARLGEEPAAAAVSSDPSLPDRLEKIAVQFEVDHPALAASTRRFIDLLGKAGI